VSSMKREPTAEEREKIGSATGGCKAGRGGVGKCSRHRRVTTFDFALLRLRFQVIHDLDAVPSTNQSQWIGYQSTN
jgi:hypothetical protein